MSDDLASFESWSEEDDAAVAYDSLPHWHPSVFVDTFRTCIKDPIGSNLELARRAFITPESESTWGDFSQARRVFALGLKISMRPLWAIDAPDVTCVRLVETDRFFVPGDLVPATSHATLVWRPEIAIVPGSSWRIHAIRQPVHPIDLPRTAPGYDPRASA